MKIAVGNVGSTSLKTKIFEIGQEGQCQRLGQADLDRVTVAGESCFCHSIGEEPLVSEAVQVFGYEQALHLVVDYYLKSGILASLGEIDAVGFKTVLAGNRGACRLTDEVISEMKRYSFVAPTHNLPYIHTIAAFRQVLGEVPLIGVFETSFHCTIPHYRRVSGLPLALEQGLGLEQRGYHGASGRFGAERVRQLHREYCQTQGVSFPVPFRVLYNHLGGSSSVHAIQDGISVATSMKFSNQSGLLQGTRVGDMDGFALLYAMRENGYDLDQMNDILSRESGLGGISGIRSGEMKDILLAAESGNGRARLALDAYEDRLRQYIGSFAAAMNGVDALVFAGGIGEKGTTLRSRVCCGLGFLGLELDEEKNGRVGGQDCRISCDSSPVQVYVIHTDEERVVAYFTSEVVRLGTDILPEEMHFSLPDQSQGDEDISGNED